MLLQNAELSKEVAVWIRIPRLPMKLYNSRFLWHIVEMDLEQPLPAFIMIRGNKLLLEYEGLHSICFRCGRDGHKVDQCKEIVNPPINSEMDQDSNIPDKDAKTEENAAVSGEKDNTTISGEKDSQIMGSGPLGERNSQDMAFDPSNEEGYGPWMVVRRNQKKKSQKKVSIENKKPVKEGKKFLKDSKKSSKDDFVNGKNDKEVSPDSNKANLALDKGNSVSQIPNSVSSITINPNDSVPHNENAEKEPLLNSSSVQSSDCDNNDVKNPVKAENNETVIKQRIRNSSVRKIPKRVVKKKG